MSEAARIARLEKALNQIAYEQDEFTTGEGHARAIMIARTALGYDNLRLDFSDPAADSPFASADIVPLRPDPDEDEPTEGIGY